MSCLSLANSLALQTDQNEKGWIRGVTQGAPFMIPVESRPEVAEKIRRNAHIARRKTSQWIQEADYTRTNIDKVVKELLWTINDISEVATQPNQLCLVNMQREHTMLQIHCCRIIRKVTKRLIRITRELAKQRVDRSDNFQLYLLHMIGEKFLTVYGNNKRQFNPDIEQEEARSLKLRQEFLKQVSFLLSKPACFQGIVIKDTAKMSIEWTYEQLCHIENLPVKKAFEIEQLRNQALEALNALETFTSENMFEECDKIVTQVNNTANEIFLAFHISWESGCCGRKAT